MGALHQQLIEYNRQHKLCLVEDIIKVEKLLYGFQVPGHDMWLKEPGKQFDQLMDMSIFDLETHLTSLSAEASQQARKLAGF